MAEFDVPVWFKVHGTTERNAIERLAQRLEVARLVRPAGTPSEPGMIESWEVSVTLRERALDTPAALTEALAGAFPVEQAFELEAMIEPESSVPPDG